MKIKSSCRLMLIGVFVIAPCSLTAGPSSYVCQITNFQIPGKTGDSRNWVGEAAMKTTVAIDRVTGRVVHPVIGSTGFRNVTLINKGSDDWSFKAIADSGEGGHVRYYEVHEYAEGYSKPFVAIADGIAFIGECR